MRVYLDAVSTTAIDSEVLNTYKQLLDKHYANSDALYDEGVAVFDMQEKAREKILELFNLKNVYLIIYLIR